MDIYEKIDTRLRELLNPYLSPFRRNQIKACLEKNGPLTILSNNCWGGHMYRYFGLPYTSPTVGMYFFASDYIKFLSSLREYMSESLVIIKPEESVHYKELVAEHPNSLKVPIGRLGDIEIVFLHSHSAEEAITKWNRRATRMNYNNLIVKMSEMNSCTPELLKDFDSLPYQRKFVFTTKDYGLNSQVIFHEYQNCLDIKNDTSKFRKYIDLINLVNGMPFKKNQ